MLSEDSVPKSSMWSPYGAHDNVPEPLTYILSFVPYSFPVRQSLLFSLFIQWGFRGRQSKLSKSTWEEKSGASSALVRTPSPGSSPGYQECAETASCPHLLFAP